MSAPYDDAYPSCEGTCATLRIFPRALDPDEVTKRLGVEPTATQREVARPGAAPARLHAWLLSSEGQVDSRDLRRHLDWIVGKLAGKGPSLDALRREGAVMDVGCVWLSSQARGGPTLSTPQMQALASLGLEVWLDVRLPPAAETL